MKPSSAAKSFQAISIGVGGLIMIVAEAASAAVPTHPKLSRLMPVKPATEQIAGSLERESDPIELAACFHKPNRIGLASVKDLLRE